VALELAGLATVNAGYAVVGAAALVAAGWVTREPATWHRLGAAFLLGIVLVAVPASYLALLRVPVGYGATAAGVAIAAAGALAVRRGRAARDAAPAAGVRLPRPGPEEFAAAAVAVVTVVLLAYAARTFAVRPLVEWDSWAVWTAKARLLYDDPSIAAAALRSGNYGQTPYPLALPTLEALGFGAMGRYDATVVGVQLLLLAAGFPLALWSLLRRQVRTWVVLLAALAVIGAPQMLFQLLTHYADVPLGLFVGAGLAAGGAFVASRQGERWLLGCFAAFLGMAGLTKSEGFLFAVAGAAALLAGAGVSRDRRRLLDATWAVGALAAIVLPWRIYCAAYGLSTPDYDLSHVLDVPYLRAHADRVRPAAAELWHQLTLTDKWGLLVWVIGLALVCGAAGGRGRVTAFAAVWLVLAAGGLLLTYWVSTLPLSSHLTNTSYRTIVSLLVGGTSLVPLLAAPRVEDG
jgi:hypothetical protein